MTGLIWLNMGTRGKYDTVTCHLA